MTKAEFESLGPDQSFFYLDFSLPIKNLIVETQRRRVIMTIDLPHMITVRVFNERNEPDKGWRKMSIGQIHATWASAVRDAEFIVAMGNFNDQRQQQFDAFDYAESSREKILATQIRQGLQSPEVT